MKIPVIETARLRLRGNYATDLKEFAAMWQQPEFYKYLGGNSLPTEEVWTKLLRHVALWPLCGFGYWAVEEEATGHFIGAVGFGEWQRNMTPSLVGYPEVGWVLAPHTHGQGYATEAVQAALAWGDAHLPQPRTVCIIDPANEPSLRLAAKLGYQEFARTLYKGQNIIVLERFVPQQSAG